MQHIVDGYTEIDYRNRFIDYTMSMNTDIIGDTIMLINIDRHFQTELFKIVNNRTHENKFTQKLKITLTDEMKIIRISCTMHILKCKHLRELEISDEEDDSTPLS